MLQPSPVKMEIDGETGVPWAPAAGRPGTEGDQGYGALSSMGMGIIHQ